MSEAADVEELARARALARERGDYARADELREEIEAAGWLVRDTADGYELTPQPPYRVYPGLKALITAPTAPTAPGNPERRAGIGLLVDGWPDDLRQCVNALIAHTDLPIIALDLGNHQGAGDVLHELAAAHQGRIEEWHVAQQAHWAGGSAGWGASRTALLRLDPAPAHVVMETSTILDGDAITPLLDALDGAVAAGWMGVDPDPGGTDWHEATGEVTALLGYLFAVRGASAFPAKARYYRNADLEFCLSLAGRLVAVEGPLPVHQTRHRGYHDVDPSYRDKESRRNYQRVMERLRHGAR